MDQEYADKDRQLALYSMWVKQNFKQAKEIKLIWHYVGVGEDVESKRTDKQLQELKQEILEEVADINRAEAEDDFPAIENKCEWCGYWQYCPLKKHLYEVKQLPENEYLKEDGVQLAKKYIELIALKSNINKEADTKKTEIDIEMEKVREAILKYAEEKKVEVLDGGEKVVAINKKTGYIIPTKTGDSEKYSELEGLLKDTKYWAKISTVNSTKLTQLLESEELNEELKKKIIALAPFEEGISLSVKKN
jgi:hypothetical protein